MEVCRLCLDLIAAQGEAKLLDGEARDMVQVVAPELNLDVSDDPLACGECTESLAALFEFKSRCFEHEAEVREKVGERRGELTLRDALAGEAGGGGDRLEEPGGSRPKAKDRLCRTCLAPIECESFTVLQPSEPDAYLSSMLDMCLVEVDLELTKDPVMCENCLENLQKLHHFKSSCQDVEDKIVEYCETHKVKEGDTIELHKVLESEMAMPDVEMALVKKEPDEAGTSGAKVKTEKESDGGDASQGDEDMSDADDELKQEEIDIKSEAGTSDSDKSLCPMCGMGIDYQDGGEFICSCCDYKWDLNTNIVSPTTCILCNYTATDKCEVEKHLTSSHQENGFYCCPNCNYKTKYYCNIKVHIEKAQFCCHLCQIQFDSCKMYHDHITTVHRMKNGFQCKKCPFKSYNMLALLKHKMDVHEDKIIDTYKKCSRCDYVSLRKYNVFLHEKAAHNIHDGMKNEYQCKQCPFKSSSRQGYYRHRLESHKGKEVGTYKCSRCDFVSLKKRSVENHEKAVHDRKNNPLNCKHCDYTTKQYTNLAVHLYNKHGIGEDLPQLRCPHENCSFQCVWKNSLTQHLNKHKNVKFNCSICSYSTFKRGQIKLHERAIHENIRYNCEHCSFTTKDKRRLKKHGCPMSTSELEQFQCPHCSFKSVWKSSLRKHLNNHSNIELNCALCSYSTCQKQYLLEHMRRDHEKLTYTCEYCDYNTKKKCRLNKHNIHCKQPLS